MKEVLSLFVYVYGLLSQALGPCSHPTLVPSSSLDTQQYLGKWYFVAAVSRNEAEVQMFREMDSTVFTLEKTPVNGTLLLIGAMRIGDKCIKQTWTYNIHPEKEELELEGRPSRRSLLWDGDWLNCSECIVLQEVEPPHNETEEEDSLNRYMLYARRSDVDPSVVKTFQMKSACEKMTAFVTLPQEKELCNTETQH
ncbi:apolipoprotein M [Polymixia lowei]